MPERSKVDRLLAADRLIRYGPRVRRGLWVIILALAVALRASGGPIHGPAARACLAAMLGVVLAQLLTLLAERRALVRRREFWTD